VETSSGIFSVQKAAFYNSTLTERIFRGKYIQMKINYLKNTEGELLCKSHAFAREKQA